MVDETASFRFGQSRRVAVVAYVEYAWDPRVRGEAEALVDDGYSVDAITARPSRGESPGWLNGVHLHEVPLDIKRGGKLRYLFQYGMFLILSTVVLWRLHRKDPFHSVHVHSLPDVEIFCALPLRIQGTPAILDLHEGMPEILAARFHRDFASTLVRLAVLAEQVSCRFATHVIAANDGIRGAIVGRGTPWDHVTTVYNVGVTQESSLRGTPRVESTGLQQGPLLVHAGGINRERDLETLLDAIARLRPGIDVHLIIAGEGDPKYVAGLKRTARDLGIGGQVEFIGRVPHESALDLMSKADVGVVTLEANPLTEIAWPTRIVEFTALGKALIVPRLTFLQRILGEGAQYYEPGNPDSLRTALERALLFPEQSQLSVAKAVAACAKLGLEPMRNSLRLVYQTVEDSYAT